MGDFSRESLAMIFDFYEATITARVSAFIPVPPWAWTAPPTLPATKFMAVDVATGEEKWSFETDHIFEISPAIGADNTVYIGRYNGSMP